MKQNDIKLALIDANEGQIEGLPQNPRTWTIRELAKLKASISETPELLTLRPIIVIKHKGRYVAIAGNMRLAAIKEMGWQSVNCIIMPSSTPLPTLRNMVIKDNSRLGSWDEDLLKNEWDDIPYSDWGIDVAEPEPEVPPGDGSATPINDTVTIEIILTPDEFNFVSTALRKIAPSPEDAIIKLYDL